MKFKNHIPIYLQIIDQIKMHLITGQLSPGDRLGSVRDYALELKVNPNTIQKAYAEMERMGLAYSKRGIGRFIVESETLVSDLRKNMSIEFIHDFIKSMKAIGYGADEIISKVRELLQEEKHDSIKGE